MNAVNAADMALAAMLFCMAVVIAMLCDDPDGVQ